MILLWLVYSRKTGTSWDTGTTGFCNIGYGGCLVAVGSPEKEKKWSASAWWWNESRVTVVSIASRYISFSLFLLNPRFALDGSDVFVSRPVPFLKPNFVPFPYDRVKHVGMKIR